jgi:hypothetical protein
MSFTTEQFLKVFESYNQAVYPAQLILLILAVAVIILAVKPGPYSSMIISATLALLWLWTGIAYHLAFFSEVNKAAYLFGLLCVTQAALFTFAGLRRRELVFSAKPDWAGIVGGSLIVFALLVYPALGFLSGHEYPRSPTFGTPCPTTIFTFGLLLWTKGRVPLYVLTIPFVWSLIAFSAALFLGMREDIGLLVAGIVGTLLISSKNGHASAGLYAAVRKSSLFFRNTDS